MDKPDRISDEDWQAAIRAGEEKRQAEQAANVQANVNLSLADTTYESRVDYDFPRPRGVVDDINGVPHEITSVVIREDTSVDFYEVTVHGYRLTKQGKRDSRSGGSTHVYLGYGGTQELYRQHCERKGRGQA